MKPRLIVAASMALGLTVVLAQARPGAAEEITVLCSNGLKAVIEDLVPKFERETKHKVSRDIRTGRLAHATDRGRRSL